MALIPVQFGRIIQNVGETVLPLRFSPDARNVDIDNPSMAASRRKGYIRGLTDDFDGPVYFYSKFTDVDGEDVHIIIDDSGVNRV